MPSGGRNSHVSSSHGSVSHGSGSHGESPSHSTGNVGVIVNPIRNHLSRFGSAIRSYIPYDYPTYGNPYGGEPYGGEPYGTPYGIPYDDNDTATTFQIIICIAVFILLLLIIYKI